MAAFSHADRPVPGRPDHDEAGRPPAAEVRADRLGNGEHRRREDAKSAEL